MADIAFHLRTKRGYSFEGNAASPNTDRSWFVVTIKTDRWSLIGNVDGGIDRDYESQDVSWFLTPEQALDLADALRTIVRELES